MGYCNWQYDLFALFEIHKQIWIIDKAICVDYKDSFIDWFILYRIIKNNRKLLFRITDAPLKKLHQ